MSQDYCENSLCGVLSLKAAVDTHNIARKKNLSPPVSSYVERGLSLGAFDPAGGWNNFGLTRLAKNFGFNGVAYKNMDAVQIYDLLRNKFFVIASLNGKNSFWKKSSDHKALITGFEQKDGMLKGFYISHYPENKFMPLEEFNKKFTGDILTLRAVVS